MREPSLGQIISAVESNDRRGALRFEPHVFARDFDIEDKRLVARFNGCTLETARVILSTSWGRFQIMGSTLYLGDRNICAVPFAELQLPILDWLCDDAAQLATFSNFVRWRHIDFTARELSEQRECAELFARRWNGPGNVANYADKLQATAKRFIGDIA